MAGGEVKAVKDMVYDDNTWAQAQADNRKKADDYFYFAVRMIFYGLGSTFVSILFLVKVRTELIWFHYAAIMGSVFLISFSDRIVKRILKKTLKEKYV